MQMQLLIRDFIACCWRRRRRPTLEAATLRWITELTQADRRGTAVMISLIAPIQPSLDGGIFHECLFSLVD
jgi:hypothetical protein